MEDSIFDVFEQRMPPSSQIVLQRTAKFSISIPPKGSELHVKNLPQTFNEWLLLKMVHAHTPVFNMRIPVKRDRSKKGYAYICLLSPQGANIANEFLSTCRHYGELSVQLSFEKTELVVGKWPTSLTAMESSIILSRMLKDVKKVTQWAPLIATTVNTGTIIIDFFNNVAAAQSKKELASRNFEVRWLHPSWDIPEATFLQMRDLHFNLMDVIDIQDFEMLIKFICGPNNVKIYKTPERNYGFLSFRTHTQAQLNLVKINVAFKEVMKTAPHVAWSTSSLSKREPSTK